MIANREGADCETNVSTLDQLRNDSCVRRMKTALARLTGLVKHIFYLEQHIQPILDRTCNISITCPSQSQMCFTQGCATNIALTIARRLQNGKPLDDLLISFKVFIINRVKSSSL